MTGKLPRRFSQGIILEYNIITKLLIRTAIFYFREAQSTKVAMACAVFLTYPLQIYPVVEISLPCIKKRFPDKFAVFVELGFRYLLVAITCKYIYYMIVQNRMIK